MSQEAQSVGSWNDLAAAFGVSTTYEDGFGQPRTTAPEGVEAILRALSVVAGNDVDPRHILAERTAKRWKRGLEPVVVAWEHHPFAAELDVPDALSKKTAECRIRFESGAERTWTVDLARQLELRQTTIDGRTYHAVALPLIDPLPTGYHDLDVKVGGATFHTRVICAPEQAYHPPSPFERSWGLFVPIHALRDESTWGVGDFRVLDEFRVWATSLGAATVGTLPLLATLIQEPFDPSPYAPMSRRMWNELFVDPRIPPEFDAPAVQSYLSRSDVQDEVRRLQRSERVDYPAAYRLKREIAHRMRAALQAFPDRRRAHEDFLAAHPDVVEYARFRAAQETKGSWRQWSQATRIPESEPGLVADLAYLQWLATEQLEAASRSARRAGLGLYLDFPLGVHGDGYDAWKDQALYVDGLSVGAPADGFFPAGQNWGFSPLNPERLREARYEAFIKAVRTHCEASGVLRIDHVMGLHRLFVIPKGKDASHGAYLHFPAEELYAVLSLESHRHRTVLVGEDLGAVPSYVRPALRRHGIHRMSVLQASVVPGLPVRLEDAPESSLATLNTHDMPPFAAFWAAQDVPMTAGQGRLDGPDVQPVHAADDGRASVKDGILAALRMEGFLESKEPTLREILEACLLRLARSRAPLLSINVEDLWLEREPQNVPGTGPERGNWTRTLAHGLGQLRRDPEIARLLQRIDAARREDLS